MIHLIRIKGLDAAIDVTSRDPEITRRKAALDRHIAATA